MAYKYETDQQFMESIVRQVGSGLRRPSGNQAYHGQQFSGFDSADDDFAGDAGEMGYEQPSEEDLQPKNSIFKRQTTPVDAEVEAPMGGAHSPQNWGGFSSDSGGSRHVSPKEPANTGMEPRMQLRKIKNQIKDLERSLHELQAKKVDVMRQLTGRL